jgi:hypothetical protein
MDGFKELEDCWGLVAHTCNPSYSGGRDQEDRSSKPGQPNSSQDPISKILNTKRAGGVAHGMGPVFKPWYHKKKKKKKKRSWRFLATLTRAVMVNCGGENLSSRVGVRKMVARN